MERQNLRAANANMQVLARDKSVDRGIGAVPAGPTQDPPPPPPVYLSGLAKSRKDLRLCFWFCSYGWVISRPPGRAAQQLDLGTSGLQSGS